MGDWDDPLHGRDLEIRRLCRSEPQFASVWDDYAEVLAVLRRLEAAPDADPAVVRDYRRLRADLGRELADWLDARRSGGGGHG